MGQNQSYMEGWRARKVSCWGVGNQVWGHSEIEVPVRVRRGEQNLGTSQEVSLRVGSRTESESKEIRQRVGSERKPS